MVNDLHDLLTERVAAPPADHLDLATVLVAGRRRVRRRRLRLVGGTAAVTALVVLGGSLVTRDVAPDLDEAGVPRPEAPTLRLSDADAAVKGEDYRVLESHTNENLNRDNGQYFDGVTDDGLILFRDGPRMNQLQPRHALVDPETGDKQWLPDPPVGQSQTYPVDLSEDRLVLMVAVEGEMLVDDSGPQMDLVAHIYDRAAQEWEVVSWPGLPAVADPFAAVVGPDDRLYVRVPLTQGKPPEGGWPTGPGGEADDADADGDTYRLWSASLSDGSDVRDEGLTVGSLAFTETSMVWTDSTNGGAGRVHVRDLESGAERAFDPRSGERCNLLSFGATESRIVLGQYCGTYDDGVRDDRVQVLDMDGDQVVTLQGSSIEGALASSGSGVVTVTSYEPAGEGTYVYDLASDRFLQVSDDVSSWATGGPAPAGLFMWNTPTNFGRGMTQHLGELVG